MRLVVRCAAKINWILKVGPRREDGYHELWTLFQSVDLWDELEVSRAPRLELECDAPHVPRGPANTVWRAAALLREHAGVAHGARLVLHKGIPAGSGLGGGSSDAAAALVALARLWGIDLPPQGLQRLAAAIGADVPFFLVGGTALGTGRGDRVRPAPPWDVPWMLLGTPPFSVSTAEVYRRFDVARERLTRSGDRVTLSGFSGRNSPPGKDFGLLENDLEPVIFEGWPQVREFRDALLRWGARAALVSGSGGAVFAVFADAASRSRAAEALATRFPDWQVRACATQPSAMQWRRA